MHRGRISLYLIGPGAAHAESRQLIRMLVKNNAPEMIVDFVDADGPDVKTVAMPVVPDIAAESMQTLVLRLKEPDTCADDYDPRLEKKLKQQERREFRSKRERRNHR